LAAYVQFDNFRFMMRAPLLFQHVTLKNVLVHFNWYLRSLYTRLKI